MMKHIYNIFTIALLFLFSGHLSGQSYTTGFPLASGITESETTITSNITNTSGNIYYTKFVVLESDATKPSLIQVYQGLGGDGLPVPSDHTKTISIPSQDTDYSLDATNLNPSTSYIAYCISYYMSGFTPTPIESTIPTEVPFTTLNATAQYTVGYPLASAISENSADIVTNLTNTGGTQHYTRVVVLESSESAPDLSQVFNGQDSNGQAVGSDYYKEISVTNADTDYASTISNLASNTDYTAYCVSFYYDGFTPSLIEQTVPTEETFTTLVAIADYTSGFPSADNITDNQVSINTSLANSSGTVYYTKFVVIPATANAPTLQQVYQGRDGDNNIVDSEQSKTITVSNSDTQYSIDATALSGSTDYIAYCITYYIDGFTPTPIETSIPTEVPFTTLNATAEYTLGYPLASAISENSADLIVNLTNTGGMQYYTRIVILESTETAPDLSQVFNGQDSNGQAVGSDYFKEISVINADTDYASAISNLASNTGYTAYCVSFYYDGFTPSLIEQTVPTEATFTTQVAIADYTIGFPNADNITDNQVSINSSLTNTDGTIYYTKFVIIPASANAPTLQQVYQGRDGDNNIVASEQSKTMTISSSDTQFSIDATALTGSTDYIAYCISYYINGFTPTPVESSIPTEVPFTTIDATAEYTVGYPLANSITENSANLITNLTNTGGKQHYTRIVILESSEPAPDLSQVFNGQDSNGQAVGSDYFKEISVTNADTDYASAVSNLTASTDYTAYCVSFYYNGFNPSLIEQTVPTEVSFTTLMASASYNIGYPNTSNVTDTQATINTNVTNTNSNVFYTKFVVLLSSEPAPSLLQVFQGLDGNNQSVPIERSKSITVNNQDTEYSINTTDLTPSSDYIAYCISYYFEDLTPVLIEETIPTELSFTTQGSIPITTFTPADGTFNVSILSNVEVSYDQAIRFIGGTEITDANVATLITLESGGSPIPFSATINAGKTLITITPSSNLPAFSYIDVTILPVENNIGTAQGSVQTCQFRTDQYNIWDGSESNDFGDDFNWVGDNFTNGISVLIPVTANNPTITSVHTTNNVNIEAGAELIIAIGGELILEGTLELASSNTEALGNATFINRGTITEMPGSNMVALQQISTESYDYFIASPVSGATPQNTGVNGSVYRRDASNATWLTLGSTEAMIAGVGYSAWSTSGTTLSFSGSFNSAASYNFSTVRTITPDNYGWNLAGNPYPCAIDWDNAGIVKTNMNNHFYVLRNESGQYGTYNGDLGAGTNVRPTNPSHIPSMHSFWTQVTIGQSSGLLTIPEGARVSSNYTYLKNVKSDTEAKSIRFKGDNSGNLDELLVAFHSSAFDSYDIYDSEKRFASYNDELLELFTVNEGKSLTIDTYNTIGDGIAINLGYKCKNAGTYDIIISDLKGFDKDVVVKIEDTSDNNAPIEELIPNIPFTFTTTSGGINKTRFVLHISEQEATNINTGQLSETVNIYNSNNNIFIDLPELTEPLFEMYDLSGRLIDNQRLQSGTLNTINSTFNGLVIVKITSKEGVISRKLNLK
ncbi:hypothetical protein [Carboxylicivirga sp. N1Y90]|uniref:hypothetical protein n=1 Tax=Carboxylicivirga fragile TaxID=3417571 RepID=UPI003D32EB85